MAIRQGVFAFSAGEIRGGVLVVPLGMVRCGKWLRPRGSPSPFATLTPAPPEGALLASLVNLADGGAR